MMMMMMMLMKILIGFVLKTEPMGIELHTDVYGNQGDWVTTYVAVIDPKLYLVFHCFDDMYNRPFLDKMVN